MALTAELRRPQLREVAGIPLQAATVDNWSQIRNFEAKPDDLLICTYPKSGDHRTQGEQDLGLLSQQGLLTAGRIAPGRMYALIQGKLLLLIVPQWCLLSGCLVSLGIPGIKHKALEDPDCSALPQLLLGESICGFASAAPLPIEIQWVAPTPMSTCPG